MNQKQLPSPTTDVTPAEPPISADRRRTMDSPRPRDRGIGVEGGPGMEEG